MNNVPLDPNAIGNLGLVNRQKIQLRQYSVIFHHLFNNAVSRSSYTSFFPDKKIYTYKDAVTGREIVGGLTLLNLMYAVIKPQLAVDHRNTEMGMEALTLSDCNNNVCNFLTNQQENVLEIEHLRGDVVTYDPQRFATLVFDELVKTNCPDFLGNVKAERSKWINRPSMFNMPQCIIDLTALYTNYKHTGLWEKKVPNHKAQLIYRRWTPRSPCAIRSLASPTPPQIKAGPGISASGSFRMLGPHCVAPTRRITHGALSINVKQTGCTAACKCQLPMTTNNGRPVIIPS